MLNTSNGFTFLFSENYRSRAYAQFFVQSGFLPEQSICIGDEKQVPPVALKDVYYDPYSGYLFRPEQQVEETLIGNCDVNREISGFDVNSEMFAKVVRKFSIKRAVYSGKAGVLFSASALEHFGEVLHVHGGYLPDFRGSTTCYFSILTDGQIGASSIVLDKEIDQGDILVREKFRPVSGINVEYVLDPLVRANVLISTLGKLSTCRKEDIVSKQNLERGTTYQVIHPVLKWKALRKISNV